MKVEERTMRKLRQKCILLVAQCAGEFGSFFDGNMRAFDVHFQLPNKLIFLVANVAFEFGLVVILFVGVQLTFAWVLFAANIATVRGEKLHEILDSKQGTVHLTERHRDFGESRCAP